MSRILRRPMFRGGPVDSRGTGITSGLGYENGGRVGYDNGGQILQAARKKSARIRNPRDFGITNVNPFFFPKTNIGTARKSKFIDTPLYEDFPEVSQFPLTADAGTIMTDATVVDTGGIEDLKTTADVEAGLETTNTNPDEFKLKKTETVKVEDDEPEVTMTDLEKALGLDRARQEYAADALAAASQAFFEGKGFGAIADAAKVKSKAPDIKRLAAIEEFKADRAEKLFDKKQKALKEQKEGTKGAFQKKLETITSQKEGTQGHVIALAEQNLQPTIQGQVASLTSKTFTRPSPAEIKGLMIAYYPQSYAGTVAADAEMAGKKAGTYITEDATTIIFWDGENATTQSI